MIGSPLVGLEGNLAPDSPACRDLTGCYMQRDPGSPGSGQWGPLCPGLLGKGKGEHRFWSLAAGTSDEGDSVSLSLVKVPAGRWGPSVSTLSSSGERAEQGCFPSFPLPRKHLSLKAR